MQNTEQYRQKLNALKDELSTRIKAIDKDIRHEDLSKDWEEQATERENDEVLDALGNASEQELIMVNAALKRIDDGSYFQCSQCGEDISEERLESLPFTTTCIQCAE